MGKRIPQLHDKEWLYEQYIVKQRTYADIGKDIGATKFGVYHAMKRFGIEARKHTSKYPKLNDKEWLLNAYLVDKKSVKAIALEVGSTPGNVHSALAIMGVKLRGPKEGWRTRFPLSRFGEEHPGWKGGITSLNKRARSTLAYKEWRKAVFERDDYTCQHCHKRGGDLEADHIKQFAYFIEARLDLANGQTLCKQCHKQTDTHSNKLKKGEL